MAAGEHLPEEDAYGPDVAFRCRLLSREPFGRDVGERSRDVSDRRQRVCAVELREAEVEEPDGDLVPILEEDVGRLHVTMDDSRPVRVRERIEHLRRNLDGVLVRKRPCSKRFSKRAAGNVFVRDVHVARVVSHVVGADAAVMSKPARREGLAFGTSSRLALPRDDLERDVESVSLVEGEPDRARAAASERPHRAVSAEDELLGRGGKSDRRHR